MTTYTIKPTEAGVFGAGTGSRIATVRAVGIGPADAAVIVDMHETIPADDWRALADAVQAAVDSLR